MIEIAKNLDIPNIWWEISPEEFNDYIKNQDIEWINQINNNISKQESNKIKFKRKMETFLKNNENIKETINKNISNKNFVSNLILKLSSNFNKNTNKLLSKMFNKRTFDKYDYDTVEHTNPNTWEKILKNEALNYEIEWTWTKLQNEKKPWLYKIKASDWKTIWIWLVEKNMLWKIKHSFFYLKNDVFSNIQSKLYDIYKNDSNKSIYENWNILLNDITHSKIFNFIIDPLTSKFVWINFWYEDEEDIMF